MNKTAEDLLKNYTVRCNVKGNYIYQFETKQTVFIEVLGAKPNGSKIPNTGQEITFKLTEKNTRAGGKTMYA
jgi:hypothetical protein